jgi:allophanate hydrolase
MSMLSGYDGSFSIGRLRAAFGAGLTPSEVVAAAYARIERSRDNPIWIALASRDHALARARELEDDAEVLRNRPLWGVPFAVKDNIDVEGLATTAGCPAYAYTPSQNAHAVQRVLDAGAILIGKTNLDQFATGLVGTRSPYGACRNPSDGHFISGGSSAGSAVAVACEQVGFALGTDTAGSGRVPAAFNNIVGLKPTRGAISVRGVVPACRSLDCVSIFANDCADALDVFRVAAGYDPLDAFSRRESDALPPLAARFRFAIPRPSQLEFHGDDEYARLYAATVERMVRIGGERVEIDFAPLLEVQQLLYEGPWLAERLAAIGPFAAAHPDAVHGVIRAILDKATGMSAVDAFNAAYRLAELRRQTEAIWNEAAVLMVPAAPTIYRIEQVNADPFELNARLGRYTNFVNLLDLAAINVPAGFRSDGLPFGVSLIAPAFADERLANLGGRLHAALAMPTGALRRSLPQAAPAAKAQSACLRIHASPTQAIESMTQHGGSHETT